LAPLAEYLPGAHGTHVVDAAAPSTCE
jgi:hypothetical protein